jgi:hypothetical protein
MREHQPNTERWGGPGASHEDRRKPQPAKIVKDADDPDHFDRRSHVSGGGGETDHHHGHRHRDK